MDLVRQQPQQWRLLKQGGGLQRFAAAGAVVLAIRKYCAISHSDDLEAATQVREETPTAQKTELAEEETPLLFDDVLIKRKEGESIKLEQTERGLQIHYHKLKTSAGLNETKLKHGKDLGLSSFANVVAAMHLQKNDIGNDNVNRACILSGYFFDNMQYVTQKIAGITPLQLQHHFFLVEKNNVV